MNADNFIMEYEQRFLRDGRRRWVRLVIFVSALGFLAICFGVVLAAFFAA